jgi:hypothetical protein
MGVSCPGQLGSFSILLAAGYSFDTLFSREVAMEPPQYPAGPFTPEVGCDSRRLDQLIAQIDAAPGLLRESTVGLSDAQLDTKYKNWTIRQIVHHVADSHVNSYVRFKWALTEETPTIKAYDEGLWAALEDSRLGAVGPSLARVEALHARWVGLLRALTPEQFSRAFLHPETGQRVALGSALCYYAWHGRHHTWQILWRRKDKGWA